MPDHPFEIQALPDFDAEAAMREVERSLRSRPEFANDHLVREDVETLEELLRRYEAHHLGGQESVELIFCAGRSIEKVRRSLENKLS